MTEPRHDSHSTEFGLWLRQQKEIDSSEGYIATNIDFLWKNYKTNEWMLIEEKRFNSQPKIWQKSIFEMLNMICFSDKKYKGFHYVVFEKTNPEDGKIYLDNIEISKQDLISFLQFDF